MSFRFARVVSFAPYLAAVAIIAASLFFAPAIQKEHRARGCVLTGVGQSVGGVSIDARGVVHNAELDALHALRDVRARAMQPIAGELRDPQELRKVSLRRLEAAVDEFIRTGRRVPEELQCLAGLQTIRYVLVYPEERDIVLAGFGEGWKVDDRGNVVGLTTGRPVLLLDDLLTALRSARQNKRGTITCSIDPTADGLKRLREYVSTLTGMGDPETTIRTIEQLLGPQVVSVTGVAATSHFAAVLVAADYRMKRLGMGFDPAPVNGFPSYLQMMRSGGRGMQNMTPRWWMVPSYAPLLVDAEGLTYELRDGAVKTLTEETFFAENGSRSQTGKTSPMAQHWADTMTAKYPELAAKEPIFAELRNCMDLAVVATLVVKEGLIERAKHDFALLLDDEQLPTDTFVAAKQIDTKANFFKRGSNWIISASGGVKIEPVEFAKRIEKSDSLGTVRGPAGAKPDSKSWWWN
jgi:uncharacterized protein DUF1598